MEQKLNKANIQDIVALNNTQKGILIEWIKGAKDLYTVQISFSIKGTLDEPLFKEATNLVQLNNDALRSVFRWEGISNPIQVILKETTSPYRFINLSSVNSIEKENKLNTLINEDRKIGFNLVELPLRIALIKKSTDEYVLTISHHHVLYDGWSTGVILKELFETYNSLKEGEIPHFAAKPDLKKVYKKTEITQLKEEKKTFWKSYLQDYTICELFKIKEKRKVTNRSKFIIKADLTPIDDFANKNQVTKAAVIYAAYGLLLQKYSGTKDVIFGRSQSNRPPSLRGIEHVIGNLINVLPIRIKSNGTTSLLELVKDT
uniref:condensation domain-containing protein n=2 Tax=Flavobacteriaceae TaxID=49546 RepID=UPI003A95A952